MMTVAPVTKYCSGCDAHKPVNEFGSDRSRSDGKNSRCKACHRAKAAAWVAANPGKAKLIAAKHRVANRDETNAAYRAGYAMSPEKFQAKTQAWRDANPEKSRASVSRWQQGNVDYRREYFKQYRSENLELFRWHDQKRRSTPKGKLENAVRSRIWKEITHGSKAGRRTFELLGYSTDELRAHIESQFLPGMSWDNYRSDTWHIDHIRPLASFSYETPDDPDFRLAWALDNLQPLWAIDNMRKGAKYTPALAEAA